MRSVLVVIVLLACLLGACGGPSTPKTPSRAASVGNLDVVTQFPAMSLVPQARQIYVVDRYVVLQAYATWVRSPAPPIEAWSFDARTGAPIATFETIGELNMEGTNHGPGVWLHPAGRLLLGMQGGALFAFDPATGKRTWKTTVYDASTMARMQPVPWEFNRVWPERTAASPANDTVYALLQEAHSPTTPRYGLDETIELVALDAATGALKWRVPLAGFDVLHEPALGLYVTDAAVVVRRGAELHAFVEGRPLWRAVIEQAPGAVVLADRSTLVVVDQGAFITVDPKTGALSTKRVDPAGLDRAGAIDDGVLYGYLRNDEGTKLVAMRASDGQRLWESRFVRDDIPNMLPPWPTGDVVYACLGPSLRAFDARSGKVLYARNVGGCAILGVAGDAVVTTFGRTDGGPSTFAPVASPMPERRIRVTGTVKLECLPQAATRVWVEDTRIVTDAAGRFDTTVTARGLVHVETSAIGELVAKDGTKYPGGANDVRNVPPDASGNVRVDFDLRMRTNCGGDYMPIPCTPVKSACPR